MSTHRHSSESGFTLIELVAVLVIMTLGTALVIPSVRAGGQQREVRRTAQRFVATVRTASSRSIQDRKIVGLEIDIDGATFRVRGGQRVTELPDFASYGLVRGGYVEDEGDRIVIDFYPTGGSAGGAVELVFDARAGRQTYLMKIDPLLSTVSIEEGR